MFLLARDATQRAAEGKTLHTGAMRWGILCNTRPAGGGHIITAQLWGRADVRERHTKRHISPRWSTKYWQGHFEIVTTDLRLLWLGRHMRAHTHALCGNSRDSRLRRRRVCACVCYLSAFMPMVSETVWPVEWRRPVNSFTQAWSGCWIKDEPRAQFWRRCLVN